MERIRMNKKSTDRKRKKGKPLNFREVSGGILSHSKYEKLKEFVAHGHVSCYEHSLRVARLCDRMARQIPVRWDYRSLIRGALLHDYYLYDWHAPGRSFRWHGFRHPAIASRLARRDFHLNDRECDMIRSHMFPLTLFSLPKSREAWLLVLADKVAAMEETLDGWKKRFGGTGVTHKKNG